MTGHVGEHKVSDDRLYRAEVFVSLKPVVNDPEGLEIRHGLHMLGYGEVEEVRSGKYLQVTLQADSPEQAHERVVAMCEQLLTNPVIEEYQVSISSPTRHE